MKIKATVKYAFTLLIASIFIIIVAVFAWSYDYVNEYQNAQIIFGISLISIGGLTLYFRYLYLHINSRDELRSLLKEFDYLKRNSRTGIFAGIGIASLLVGVLSFIYQPAEKNIFSEKIFEIVALYVTSIISFLVIRSIFEKAAPISDVETLLVSFCDDIEAAVKKGNSSVWISFPALIIGYYRKDSNQVAKSYYKNYINALNSIIEDESIEVRIITYKIEHYEKLFEEYVKMNTDGYDATIVEKEKEKTDKVIRCRDESISRFNSFLNATSIKKCHCHPVEPLDLVEHFIIIGDIVYTITTFDLPVYKRDDAKGTYSFMAPEHAVGFTKDKLAKLYAYRQEDTELAELIIKKYQKQLKIA